MAKEHLHEMQVHPESPGQLALETEQVKCARWLFKWLFCNNWPSDTRFDEWIDGVVDWWSCSVAGRHKCTVAVWQCGWMGNTNLPGARQWLLCPRMAFHGSSIGTRGLLVDASAHRRIKAFGIGNSSNWLNYSHQQFKCSYYCHWWWFLFHSAHWWLCQSEKWTFVAVPCYFAAEAGVIVAKEYFTIVTRL